MRERPEAILRQFHAWEPRTDKVPFQWRARLLQSVWREAAGLKAGEYRSKTRGARLVMPEAAVTLANYLTENIRAVVRREVEDPSRSRGKLYGKPRIYDNLLSSQPLCFNLFAELSIDLALASGVFQDLTNGRVREVLAIDFEHSPGRGDPRYTGDRSAFDVYVSFLNARNQPGFIGIEVKYHENLQDEVSAHRARYDQIAAEMGCFHEDKLATLKRKPLQQIWRDHLLVGAHQFVDAYADALFVFLYPEENTACAQAVQAYECCLNDNNTFEGWTLERVVSRLSAHSEAEWIQAFRSRYLDFAALPKG